MIAQAIDEIERLRAESELRFQRMEYATTEHAKLMMRLADAEKVIEAAREHAHDERMWPGEECPICDALAAYDNENESD